MEDVSDTIAYVNPPPRDKKFIINSSNLRITQINNVSCDMLALLDTGSPVSLMSFKTFSQFFGSFSLVKNNIPSFNAVNGTPIKIIGSVTTPVKLEVLPNSTLMVTFLVTESSFSSSRLILGCDFLNQHKIVITIDVTDENVSNRVQLFSEVASTEIIDCAPNEIEELLTDINIDFDSSVKQQLISTIKEVNDTHIPLVNDDYSVKINLKDESIFAFSPRRFAFAEKLQIREIVDDLLDRKIIKESNSQNIARE